MLLHRLLLPLLGVTVVSSGDVTIVTGTSGTITSPNWPLPYNHSTSHRWVINVPTGNSIQLNIDRNFSLESAWLSSECYDSLNIIDVGSVAEAGAVCSQTKVKEKHCGEYAPESLVSCSNVLILDFCSDETVELRGFSIQWSAITSSLSSTESTDAILPPNCGVPYYKPDIEMFPNGTINRIRPLMRIVGGQTAIGHSWPWAVNFWQWLKTLGFYNNFCGGSVINNHWIVTAAHCFEGRVDYPSYKVKLGAFNKGDDPTPNEDSQRVCGISKVVVHPGYDHVLKSNDIALVKVDCYIDYSSEIQPLCLAETFDLADEEHVAVVGWGTVRRGGVQSKTLQEVVVDITNFNECNNDYGAVLDNTMFCAAAPGMDACQGDSGGPLMSYNNGTWFLDGIVSWGNGCADYHYPGVYTKAALFRDWVVDVIRKDTYSASCV